MYPDYDNLDLKMYPRIDGMYSLGFVQTHRPEICIITDKTESKFDPVDIILQIDHALRKNKKAALFFWDEDFIMPNKHSDELNQLLENYRNEPVYLCSNMDSDQLLIYTDQREIPIKVVHVPWWYMNMIPAMLDKKTHDYLGPVSQKGNHWACLINRPDPHKNMLVDALKSYNLQGLIQYNHSSSVNSYYLPGDQDGWHSSHDMKRSLIWNEKLGYWIDHNTRNITRLEQILGDCPMIINPETTGGIFPMTEKSFWPIVLDRMFILWARPGIMQDIQSYLDYDLALYLDLEFDSIDGYEPQDQLRRLECLIDKNHYTISHARDIYPTVAEQIRNASRNIGPIFYRKFCKSLDSIV